MDVDSVNAGGNPGIDGLRPFCLLNTARDKLMTRHFKTQKIIGHD